MHFGRLPETAQANQTRHLADVILANQHPVKK